MARAQKKDKQEQKDSLGRYWHAEIQSSKKEFEKWGDRGRKIVRRYRDERDAGDNRQRKFNILWSNVQVLKPALYGRMPKPEVTRRFKDQDPIGRTAATMLERCLEFEVEQYKDFDSTMSYCVEDRLLPGRGTSWIRYTLDESAVTNNVTTEKPYECAPLDYVYWRDFFHSPARTWEEVWYVGRWVYMTKEEGVKRFGAIFNTVPLNYEEDDGDQKGTKTEVRQKKAKVAEIWDKTEKHVVWIAKGLDQELDVKPDPLQLEDFFPCPKPLYATMTTGSLVPVPDYAEYQDQAEELDILTQRISRLTRALKVVGVYNAEYPAVKRMLQEGFDNELIPVDAWAAFAEKGGIEGAVVFLQIKEVMDVVAGLFEARERCKQVIYETMGISDVIRGSTDASETLGAQELKAQFGSMRLKSSQGDVARFATDNLRLKAQIICKFYSDETIVQMSGAEQTLDKELIPQALQLLRKGPLKDFRIEVAADTLAQIDEAREKQEAGEFITSMGAIFKEALPVVQMAPTMLPFVGEIMLLAARKQRAGRALEASLEQCLQQTQEMMMQQMQNPQPDPKVEAEKAKAEVVREKGAIDIGVAREKAQIEREKMAADRQHQEAEIVLEGQKQQMEMAGEAQRMAMEDQRMQREGEMAEREMQQQERALARDEEHQQRVMSLKERQLAKGPKK
jgi:hypothetical protein